MSWLINKLRNLFRRDDGVQMIEFAIVFPVMLLLFAGTAELGRLFYTYTTLAKATRGGARYLSLVTDVNLSTTAGKNMVMCGNTAGCGGAGQPAVVVPNLTASNIVITPPVNGVGAKYVKVEIVNYTYQPLVFNLNSMTGGNFNLTLTPSTTMRHMRF